MVVPLESAEDVILKKRQGYRQGQETSVRQWQDVIGVIKVQGPTLDSNYLNRWARELGIIDILERAWDQSR